MSKVIYHEADRKDLSPLTDDQKAELKTLSEISDAEIDYSDIPELDDSFKKNAVRNPFYRPNKTSATARIDSDILAWLKSQGKGYQTRLNNILREAMIRSLDGNSQNDA
ncbi:MAG: BrnA antitoxin family protein [Deltaproteobacteria bacterium]|jgi:uncharacterized protein (DUF4415 family)|nr:BrnA antitoxin family protein [Deltaproteobacteria bacterium]